MANHGLLQLAGYTLLLASIAEEADAVDTTPWSCKNDFEIQCDVAVCELEDPTTTMPMRLSFTQYGKYSLCAYSGCWEGHVEVLKGESHLIISDEYAHWNQWLELADSADQGEPILIALDLQDQVAVVKVGSFAQPFRCERKPGADSIKPDSSPP